MKILRQTLYVLLAVAVLGNFACGHKGQANAAGDAEVGGGDGGTGDGGTGDSGAQVVQTGFNVSSIVPADGAGDVAVSLTIVATFNAAVDATTLSGNFVVSAAESPVEGTFTLNEDKTEVTFTPSANLTGATSYDVSLTGSVKSATGTDLTVASSSFETVVAPTVVVKNSEGIALASTGDSIAPTTDLKLFFSEPMDADTISTDSVVMTCNNVVVTPALAAVEHDNDSIANNEWTLFFGSLPQNNCVLSFGNDIADANGTAMSAASFSLDSICGPDDEFADESTLTNCWTENDTSNWATFDIDTNVSETLFFSHSGTDSSSSDFPVIWKRVIGDFAVTASFNSTDTDTSREALLLSAVEAASPVTNALDLWFGRNSNYHPTNRTVYYGKTVSGVDSAADSAALTTAASKIYLCIVRSGDTVTGYYAANTGDSFTAVSGSSTTISTTDETDIQMGGLSTGNGFTFEVDYVHFNMGSTTCPAAE